MFAWCKKNEGAKGFNKYCCDVVGSKSKSIELSVITELGLSKTFISVELIDITFGSEEFAKLGVNLVSNPIENLNLSTYFMSL